jgi:glucokinase
VWTVNLEDLMIGAEVRYLSGNRSPQPVLGLDIGGTKLAVGVVTPDGVVHGFQVAPTRTAEGWEAVLERLFDLGRHAIDMAGLGPVGAVGIACGGPLDSATGVLFGPPNLPGWAEVPVGARAAAEFGLPFALYNDATASAIAEYRFGAGQGARTMLYLTVSTGIGGGVIIDGVPHLGAAGNGGEFGHITVRRDGRRCGCGRRGCVEAYASGSSIARRTRDALDQGARSSLAGLPTVTAADVAAAARAGDPLAGELWDETVDLLGAAVTDLVNVFEPDLVVLGGGVTRAGPMLFEPLRALVARETLPLAVGVTRVVPSGLGELVGVVGAGAIAHDLLERVGSGPARHAQGKETHV